MQPGQQTWLQLQPLYNQLLNAIGSGNPVTRDVYESLMNNLDQIPDAQIWEYRRAVVAHLLTMVGTPYTYNQNLHPGDVIEESIIGIPRENNVKIGDLLGLELKSFSGRSPLSLTSFSCVSDLVNQVPGANGVWDVVWFPTHVNHAGRQRGGTYHLRANENIRHDEPNEFDNLRLRVEGNSMVWRRQPGDLLLKEETLESLFDKFTNGILILDIDGTRADRQFTINQIYYVQDFTPQGIGQHFMDNNIKFEIRYDFTGRVDGLWTCETPRNTGHAFRMTVGSVRRQLMTSSNEINTIGDFP